MRKQFVLLLMTCFLATPALPAVGSGAVFEVGDGNSPSAAWPARDLRIAQNDGMTLSQAVEQVRRQYNGRIVSAETKRSGNREVHHIKVLTQEGKVITVRIPGRTLRS